MTSTGNTSEAGVLTPLLHRASNRLPRELGSPTDSVSSVLLSHKALILNFLEVSTSLSLLLEISPTMLPEPSPQHNVFI